MAMCSRHPWLVLIRVVLVLVMLVGDGQVRAEVPAIIVFGDSTVDAGNNNQIPTIAQSNFEPYGRDYYGGRPTGRFCNGRISTDFISEAFGLRPYVPAYLDPMYDISDFSIGVTFGSAGTGYDNATSDVLSVIPLWKELEFYKDYQNKLRAYLGEEKASEILSEALYVISIGTNDFLENYFLLPNRRCQFDIDQYQIFLIEIARNFINNLYSLGARKVSLGGLPPMGCLPLERSTNFVDGHECVQNHNDVAIAFNERLEGLVAQLSKELPGIRVILANPYYILMQMILKPSLYGFEETAVGCCGTGLYEMGYVCEENSALTCKDATKFVFWDSFHPTEKTNYLIVQYLLNSSMTLLL